MRRVLLVDDSKAVRQALQAALEPYGFEVQHAENGASALVMLRRSQFDIAFVDLNMPVLDGSNLLRMMRAQGITTKVILVTVSSSMPLVGAAIKLGASDYVNKPFTPEAIRVAVARLLGIDPSALQLRPSRVLLQHPDPAILARLRSLLPKHVELTSAVALTQVLEAVEKTPFDLVLLDEKVLEGEVTTAAMLVRKAAPDAAVFALAKGAPEEARWVSDEALDGRLPLDLDEAAVRDFLYANYLRPLVFLEGTVFHAAGFEGGERNLPAYFTALGRALYRRATQAGGIDEPSIDLTRVPPFPGRIAELMEHLRVRLDVLGIVPSFRVAAALVAPLTARPDLHRVVIFA